MMIVFTLFFGKLAKVPSDGVPYPIFSFSAMVAWTYFANAVTFSRNSLVQDVALISKVYFPRLMSPMAPVVGFLLDFSIAFIALLGMMVYFNMYPTAMIVFLPGLVILLVLTAGGTGTLLAALNVRYRDVKYAVILLIQLWLFASPVVYPASMVPENYRLWYFLNPMAGIIEGFRSILLGTTPFPGQELLVSALVGTVLFIVGLLYFKQTERFFADVI